MVSDNEPRYRLLDSSGAVVGTIYERTDGSLALQEATTENEIALRPDGDITAVGSVLRRLGHDEVDVPQTFDLVTDDFERASLESEYVGDLADAQIQSSLALEGERSLEIAVSNGVIGLLRYDGGDGPQLGDTGSYKVFLTDADDEALVSFLHSAETIDVFNGTGVRVRVEASNDAFELVQHVGGSIEQRDTVSASVSSHLNETLTVKFTLGLGRTLTATLLNASGTELASLSTSLDSRLPQAGGVGYTAFNGSSEPTIYFDGPFIKRRLGEETRERQRGSTETSKLQTRGGVGAGPRILPENEPAGVLSDQGITSELSQGTQVGYGLQLNGKRGLELRGEADGNGGVQNFTVDVKGVLQAESASVSGVNQRAIQRQVDDAGVISKDAKGSHFIFVSGAGDDQGLYASGFDFVNPIFEGPQMDNLSGQTATGTTGTDGSVTTFRDGNTIGLENRTGTNQTFFIFTIGD